MNDITSKSFRCLRFFVEANFFISVIVLLAASFMSVTDSGSLFEFNEELYGPLAGNLRIMLVYLAVTEVIICAYCFIVKKFQVFMVVGMFLILMVGSLQFYGSINDIEADPGFFVFFLYTGLSHILFGAMAGIDKKKSAGRRHTGRGNQAS